MYKYQKFIRLENYWYVCYTIFYNTNVLETKGWTWSLKYAYICVGEIISGKKVYKIKRLVKTVLKYYNEVLLNAQWSISFKIFHW